MGFLLLHEFFISPGLGEEGTVGGELRIFLTGLVGCPWSTFDGFFPCDWIPDAFIVDFRWFGIRIRAELIQCSETARNNYSFDTLFLGSFPKDIKCSLSGGNQEILFVVCDTEMIRRGNVDDRIDPLNCRRERTRSNDIGDRNKFKIG
jgi:hypothetical protein